MSPTRILVILCLALGAVSAEVRAQSSLCRFSIPSGPVSIGSSVPCAVAWADPIATAPAQIGIFLGTQAGTSAVSVGGQNLVIPLGGAVYQVASATGWGGLWKGRLAVPADPSLVGHSAWSMAVVVPPSGGWFFSTAVPFGPIIEDSIN